MSTTDFVALKSKCTVVLPPQKLYFRNENQAFPTEPQVPSKTYTLLFFFPSTTFFATPFQHFLFFRDFSACKRHRKLRDEWHMQNMASKEKLLKVSETNFLIIFALLLQFKALLPQYVPVLQPGYVERHDLIECYFKLELQHREILAFLMLSHGIVSASAGENFGSQGITQKA